MGFVCELFVAGAITATFNVNSGVQNPERVCTAAAMVQSAEGPVGAKTDFTLSNNGQKIPEGSGSITRNANQPNPYPGQTGELFSFNIKLDAGKGPPPIPINPMTIDTFKINVARDTTPGIKR